MNELRKTTITALEVAEMMETEHWKILRKLEGRTGKDGQRERGYAEILTDNHLVVSDYFIPSTYKDASGKENKCYEVTRMGCDFLANKSTGEKGVLFTARYVKRFNEMENQTKQVSLTEHPGEVANLIKVVTSRMDKQGSAPYESMYVTRMLCEQYGIQLPESIVKVPEYEQLALSQFMQ